MQHKEKFKNVRFDANIITKIPWVLCGTSVHPNIHKLIDKNETIQLIGSINWANHLLIAYSTLHKHSSFPPQIVYDKNVNPIYHNRRFGKEKKVRGQDVRRSV